MDDDIMNAKDFILEINKKIDEKSILKHPFYQQWKSGKLTRAMLQHYAKQYYKHVSAFPRYLSSVHSKVTDQNDRQLILQNLIDEENGEKNHPNLWMQFGEALNLKRDEIEKAQPADETIQFVSHFLNSTGRSVAEGIAALYTYESQIPEVSHEKIKGLVDFYGVATAEGLEYFEVHEKADVEHSRAEIGLLAKYAKDGQTQKMALKAVDETLDAYWNMLSGVQKAFMQC